MRLRELAVFAGFILMVAGCGGGGGDDGSSDSSKTANVNVSVNWAARSKAVNAPSSALSLVITLKKANPTTGDFSFTINRDAAPAAYTKKYTSGNQAKQGTWDLAAKFFSQPDGAGSVVGTIDATINLDRHGNGIGNFTTVGKIATVEIAPNQTVGVGQSIDLVVTAKDSSGAAIALTPGSFFLQGAGGSGLTVGQGQQVTGQAVGTAMVTATVDGITSLPQTVTIGFVPAVKVTPDTAATLINGSLHLSATVDSSPDSKLIWSVQEGAAGGTVQQNGTYVAPGSAGTYHVVVTSHFNTSRTAIATVIVGGVAPAPSGIYVADTSNNRIVRMDDMTGKNWTAIGTLGNGQFQFSSPYGIHVSSGGKIYVADSGNNRIVQMDDMTGKNWHTLGIRGHDIGQFNIPSGITASPDGKIFVADLNNFRVVRIDDISGAGWVAYGTGKIIPVTCRFAADGDLYIEDVSPGNLAHRQIIRIDGIPPTNTVKLALGSAFNSGFVVPYGLDVDSHGDVFVTISNEVQEYQNFSATSPVRFSGLGGSREFLFTHTVGVSIGPDGKLYLTDNALGTNSFRIVRVDDMTGTNWVSFGTVGNGIGQFNNPAAIFAR